MKRSAFLLEKNSWCVQLLTGFLLIFSTTVCGQTLLPTITSLKQTATGLPSSAGNHHTIAVYPDGALSYYEYWDFSDPTSPLQKGKYVYNKSGVDVYSFDLKDNCYAKDFRQLAGTSLIVFGGYKVDDPTYTYNNGIPIPFYDRFAIVGWFDLDEIKNGNVRIEYVDVPDIAVFWKVEPFFDGQSIHLAAIGQLHDDLTQSAIFHLGDVQLKCDSAESFNCNLYSVRADEVLLDIVRTEQFITFVGFDFEDNGLSIRRELYSYMGSPNELGNIYVFPYPDDDRYHNIIAAFMGNKQKRLGDSIAVSILSVFDANDVHSRYRFIDIGTLSMFNAQEFKMHDKIAVKDITYVHGTKTLCSLTSDNPVSSSPDGSIVLLDPSQNTPYTTTYIFDPGIQYANIDCLNYSLNDSEHCLLGGPWPWFLKT